MTSLTQRLFAQIALGSVMFATACDKTGQSDQPVYSSPLGQSLASKQMHTRPMEKPIAVNTASQSLPACNGQSQDVYKDANGNIYASTNKIIQGEPGYIWPSQLAGLKGLLHKKSDMQLVPKPPGR